MASFYEEYLVPIIKKVCPVIEQTPHMQDILNGTISKERFEFQIRQNYQYLLDYTRCWAVGLTKCQSYDEMQQWYSIVKSTMESTVAINRTYWSEQIGVTPEELDKVIEAPGKRSYTSFQLMCAESGGLDKAMMALMPCNILYRFFGEDLLPKCTLSPENKFYKWLEFYTTKEYIDKTENEIRMANELCAHKTLKEKEELVRIFAISCNYEILQWQDMYHNMTTWPLDSVISDINIVK